MGGRAAQEMSFSYDSVSKLQVQGITIKSAAKAMFFGNFMKSQSFNMGKSQTFNLAEWLKKDKFQFYIGGKPPLKGNVRDWMAKVREVPMPIRYQLKEISSLFKFIPSIDSDSA